MTKGWFLDNARHALARIGIKTTGYKQKEKIHKVKEEMCKVMQLTEEEKREYRAMAMRAKSIGEQLPVDEFLQYYEEEKDYQKHAKKLFGNVKNLNFTKEQKEDYRKMLRRCYQAKIPMPTPEDYLMATRKE